MKKRKLHYGWVVFVMAAFLCFFALGFTNAPKSLYLSAITEDMGFSRTAYSISDTCRHLVYSVYVIFFGALVAKIKPRGVAAIGFSALIASCLISSFATALWQFYVGGALLGIGLASTTTALAGVFVKRWFADHHVTLLGITLATSGLGGAVSSPILSKIIYSSSDGWRSSYRFVAILLIVVGVLELALLRNDPADVGLQPISLSGKEKTKKRGSSWEGLDFSAVKRSPIFYVACAGVFLTGFCLQGTISSQSAHLRDIGIDQAVIATVLSVQNLSIFGAKTYTGFSHDKFGLRVTLLVCDAAAVFSLAFLGLLHAPTAAFIYSVVCAFSLPLETVMLSLIASGLFGKNSSDKVLGVFLSMNYLGFAAGVPMVNLGYDLLGSYSPVLLILAGVMLLVGIAFQLCISASDRLRAASEE